VDDLLELNAGVRHEDPVAVDAVQASDVREGLGELGDAHLHGFIAIDRDLDALGVDVHGGDHDLVLSMVRSKAG